MIKNVIKFEKGVVIVLDEHGEQILEYQGQYEEVRERILRDAPPDAVFGEITHSLRSVPREEW